MPRESTSIAEVGQVYEFPVEPSGYPAAKGNRYEIYECDDRFGLLIGRNLTDPGAVDIHGAPDAWPKVADLVEADER